jgi:hypothetical protein
MDISLLVVIILLWLLGVSAAAVYVWIKVMPVVRIMKKTTAGQHALTKVVFPPRFHK